MNKTIQAKLRYLRLVLPLVVSMVLAACAARIIQYQGNCGQQTQQFLDHIHALVRDEISPVLEDGYRSGPSADVMRRISALDQKISDINTPECNARTEAVKDSLRLYLLEARNYFTTVAGRAVYGEGQVQGHLSKLVEAGLAFEKAFVDVQK